MRVIVTGSPQWADPKAVHDALTLLYRDHGPFTLVHSSSAIGADARAQHWYEAFGREMGVGVLHYKPDWTWGEKAKPRCNAKMIKAGGDLLLAFPLPGDSEVQQTIDLARWAGIEVREHRHA